MCVSATMQTINRATLFEVYKLHVKNCTSVKIYFLQYIIIPILLNESYIHMKYLVEES